MAITRLSSYGTPVGAVLGGDFTGKSPADVVNIVREIFLGIAIRIGI